MNSIIIAYTALGFAIVNEVLGTTFLAKSEQFTKLTPSILTVLFYGASFYLLSIALKGIPLGIAYAIWAGLGIVLTAVIGSLVFKQVLDLPAMLGIALIVGGVVVINVFSQSTGH